MEVSILSSHQRKKLASRLDNAAPTRHFTHQAPRLPPREPPPPPPSNESKPKLGQHALPSSGFILRTIRFYSILFFSFQLRH